MYFRKNPEEGFGELMAHAKTIKLGTGHKQPFQFGLRSGLLIMVITGWMVAKNIVPSTVYRGPFKQLEIGESHKKYSFLSPRSADANGFYVREYHYGWPVSLICSRERVEAKNDHWLAVEELLPRAIVFSGSHWYIWLIQHLINFAFGGLSVTVLFILSERNIAGIWILEISAWKSPFRFWTTVFGVFLIVCTLVFLNVHLYVSEIDGKQMDNIAYFRRGWPLTYEEGAVGQKDAIPLGVFNYTALIGNILMGVTLIWLWCVFCSNLVPTESAHRPVTPKDEENEQDK